MTEKYSIACVDLGVTWCDAILYADSEDELFDECVRHGQDHKGISEEMIRSPEFLAMIRDKMRLRD